MTHHHLRLDCLDCFKRDTDYDEKRRPSQSQLLRHPGQITQDDWHNGDYTQEKRAEECNAVENSADKIACGLAGAEPGDKAAVIFEIVGNFYRIKLNRLVEITERHN